MSSPRLIIQGFLPGFPPKPSRPVGFRKIRDRDKGTDIGVSAMLAPGFSFTHLLIGDAVNWDPAWALVSFGPCFLLLFAAQDKGIELISPVEPQHIEPHIGRLKTCLAALETEAPDNADSVTVARWKKLYEREINNLNRALHVLAFRDMGKTELAKRPRIYRVLPTQSGIDPPRNDPPHMETYLVQDDGVLTGKKGQPTDYTIVSDPRSKYEIVLYTDPHTKATGKSQVDTLDASGRIWTRDLAVAKRLLHHFWRIHPADGSDKIQTATERLETALTGQKNAPSPEPKPAELAAPSLD